MISTDTSTATGVLTGPTQTIVLDFYFMANTDLVVTRTRAGVITTLTLDSDYSVLGAGNESGGSITVTGQASGDVITIERTIDYKQISDYIPLTKLSATTIERDFDRCAMRDQQIVRRVKSLEDNPSTGIEEAPIDGTSYARKDAGWVTLAGGGDMLKSTYDSENRGYVDRAVLADTATTAGTISGSITISQVTNLSSELSAIIEEAPIDGTSYARKDATWVSLAGGGDMLKSVYDTDNDGKVDTAEVADSATYATTAGTISGSITISQVSDAGDSASLDVGTTTGTVAAGDDSRIVAGGTALQPTGSGASLTGMTASQVGLGNVDNTSDANKPVSTATQTALNAKQTADADLTAIAGLSGTAGLLRKTAADTWSLDTNVYLTGNETITLSGDATGSGTTAITVTLADSGVSAGSYGSATAVPAITVDAKGRVTAVTATSIHIAESQVTNLPADLAAKAALTGATFTGDVAVTESSSMGNLLTITNTDATNYSRIKYVGTGNTFSAGVGNASATIAELRNNFYVYDFTGAKSILIGTPSGVWNLTQYTASRALALDDSKNIVSSATTAVELGYVHGVTSPIQEQLAGKAASADLTAEVTRAAAAEALKAPLSTPIITEATATRTLALTDANSIIRCTYASAVAITVPPSASVAFGVGTTILIRQAGVGQITLAAGSGVTLNSSTTLKTKGQHATVALTKIASDEWDVTGERALA